LSFLCIDIQSDVHSETNREKDDIYVRHDGEILRGKNADAERRRSIAKRKARDIQKLSESVPQKVSQQKFGKPPFFTTTMGKFSAQLYSASRSAKKAAGQLNVSNTDAKGVKVNAKASATGVSINTLSTSISGVNASAGATAEALNVSCGNINATAVDIGASVSASAAKVSVGNMKATGSSVGVSAKINGTGLTAGNIAFGGPSASVSFGVDNSFSFGNLNIGLAPVLKISAGLNFGIPFLSASTGGSSSGSSNGRQQRSEKESNHPTDEHARTNKSEELERGNGGRGTIEGIRNRHKESSSSSFQFLGSKRGSEQSLAPVEEEHASIYAASNTGTQSVESDIRSGMSRSPSSDVTAGYACNSGHPSATNRLSLTRSATPTVQPSIDPKTPAAVTEDLKAVNDHSIDKRISSRSQPSNNPDLRSPETTVSSIVRDEHFAQRNVELESSAHQSIGAHHGLDKVRGNEAEHPQIVSGDLVILNDASDGSRHDAHELLRHVFQSRSSYRADAVPSRHRANPTNWKRTELTEDDELLLEECHKLGLDISGDSLSGWKKQLKSDEEYQREEDKAQSSTMKNFDDSENTTGNPSDENNEEINNEPSKPCKDHASNVRCMKCMNGTSGLRIRRLHGSVYGFHN
jgi:hypothetical protein